MTCSASLGSRPIPSNGTNLSFAQTFAQEVTAWEFTWVKGLFHFICILLQAAFSKWVLFNIWSPKHGWSIYFRSLLRIQNLFKNSNIAAIYFKRGNRAGLLVCFVENAGSLEFPLKIPQEGEMLIIAAYKYIMRLLEFNFNFFWREEERDINRGGRERRRTFEFWEIRYSASQINNSKHKTGNRLNLLREDEQNERKESNNDQWVIWWWIVKLNQFCRRNSH